MTIFYFTSTGNSLAVAKKIGGGSAAYISIPQIIDNPSLLYKDGVIGVVYPIYGFGLPKMVRRFFEKVKWEADYAFAIGTYGNLPGAAARNTQFLAQEQGLRLDYSTTLLMVDNYLPGFEVNDQIAKLPVKKPDENLARIIADITDHKPLDAPAGLGWRAATAAIKAAEKAFMNNTRNYIVDEKCTKCGTCAKVCPAANITVIDKVTFSDKCEWCLGCVHLCPKNALHMKNEKSAARWRHPDVTLTEIIKANDRTVTQ
ncbi:hypothetical protein FACS1894202_03840 [Clostridia bacterium]|nr:hypothetical protein FACS1894202_03840 [Clostridia bacterium]